MHAVKQAGPRVFAGPAIFALLALLALPGGCADGSIGDVTGTASPDGTIGPDTGDWPRDMPDLGEGQPPPEGAGTTSIACGRTEDSAERLNSGP